MFQSTSLPHQSEHKFMDVNSGEPNLNELHSPMLPPSTVIPTLCH